MSLPPVLHCAQRLLVFTTLVLLAFLAVTPGSIAATAKPREGEGPWNLTIYHTNDIHAAFLPQPASWREDRAEVGGLIALAWHLEDQRRDSTASILLDAGDFMTGNPICEIEVDEVRGAGFLDMLNLIGYDASVVGNHEFDLGRKNAHALAARARFPLLAADILNEAGDLEFAQAPVVLERGDLRIGIMGVSCNELFRLTTSSRTGGLSLRGQATVVRGMIQQLDPETDLLVLITHNGVSGDEALARQLAGSGLDVIVGGHSHTRLNKPVLVDDILIVQAGSKLQNLGRLDLQVVGDRVVSYRGRLVPLLAEGTSASAELTHLVEEYQRRIADEFGQVIGRLQQEWRRATHRESNIGNWIADQVRERAQCQIAFMNAGGIRKDLPLGPITLLDMHEILPFANSIVRFELDGAQLMTVLEENARAAATQAHGILQVSGLRYSYRAVGDHVELTEVEVGGQRLRKDRVYQVAAPDYVVAMADVYFNLQPPPEAIDLEVRLADAMIAAIQVEKVVHAEVEGRIRDVTGTRAAER